MALTKKHRERICLEWQGAKECRYMAQDMAHNRCMCLKLLKSEKDKIDKEIEDFIKDCKKNGQDPTLMGRALGDNCQGYIYLRFAKQGYDVTP